jgi:hypothetical protein
LAAPTAQDMAMYGKFMNRFMERGTEIKDYIMVSAEK